MVDAVLLSSVHQDMPWAADAGGGDAGSSGSGGRAYRCIFLLNHKPFFFR